MIIISLHDWISIIKLKFDDVKRKRMAVDCKHLIVNRQATVKAVEIILKKKLSARVGKVDYKCKSFITVLK